MTPELWQRLKPLYDAALDLPTHERGSFIQQVCGSDLACAAELHALLAASDGSTGDLASPFANLSQSLLQRPALLALGTLFADRFRIVRHIGSGGMGDVYEAHDELMGNSPVALKTIRPSIADNPLALTRFKEEVRLARQVTGPNVCRIHELHLLRPSQAGCSAFLTMELLDGLTLHDHIAAASPLPLREIRRLFEQLCTGLGCIHQAGIVHGDLKPRNVMLVPQPAGTRVVVTDFGLARSPATSSTSPTSSDAPASPLEAATITGTPSYMAPEQFEGREAGPPTDIYALGVILYEMSTGLQPFAAHTPLAAAIRRSKPPTHASSLRPDLPASWDSIISRCLCYHPDQRFASAAAVLHSLQHPRAVALRMGPSARLVLPTRALIAVLTVVFLLVCTALWFTLRPRHRELSPEAAHWYTLGIAALREGSYMKATRLLNMVVARDPSYALAHAALADAWAELDFTESAQHEMLLATAPAGQRGLSDLDHHYIDAVRSTLVRDYAAAAQDYEAILHQLPADSKAQGYVDLGRIYERSGRVQDALKSYETAARLSPDDPAPFLHLGILRSRLRNPAAADAAFSRAESLYNAESDLGGLAEVAYQRGYAANDTEDFKDATRYLDTSLALARQMPSVQLEVRSLAQLSSVAYNNNKDDEAIQLANQIINTARENQLEYWVTDGLVRLGNAQLDKGQYDAADLSLQDALRRADENNHPRLQATAALSLASLRYQQQRWKEDVTYAQQALKYFQDYGFLDSADQALVLMARAQQREGNYTQALAGGQQLLQNAEQAHRAAYELLAEELIGNVLLRLQRYPDALVHFTHALNQADSAKQETTYLRVRHADVLWQLGRYDEALADLAQLPVDARKRQDVGADVAVVLARLRLSRGEAAAALAGIEDAWRTFPALSSSSEPLNRLLLRTAVLTELELHQVARAQNFADKLLALSPERADAWDRAQTELMLASLALSSGNPSAAKPYAENAGTFFQAHEMLESDALSYLTRAQAATATGDAASADTLSNKSVDLFRSMAHSWGDSAFHTYEDRPDRTGIFRALAAFRAAHGDTLDLPKP